MTIVRSYTADKTLSNDDNESLLLFELPQGGGGKNLYVPVGLHDNFSCQVAYTDTPVPGVIGGVSLQIQVPTNYKLVINSEDSGTVGNPSGYSVFKTKQSKIYTIVISNATCIISS